VLLENRGSTGIGAAISIRHRGSDWSKEWEFDLPAKDDGPFSFPGGSIRRPECAAETLSLPSARQAFP
jgi:ABC-type phosphonate transport system ATPase subunit